MREKEQKEEWFGEKRKTREQRAAEVHKLQWRKKRTRVPSAVLSNSVSLLIPSLPSESRGEAIVFMRIFLEIFRFVQRLGFTDYNFAGDLVSRQVDVNRAILRYFSLRKPKLYLTKSNWQLFVDFFFYCNQKYWY